MAPHRKSYFYYNNYRFYKEKTFTSGASSGQPRVRNYYKCSVKTCKGRLVEFPIGTFNQTVEHTCELNENVRAKEAALGKLRELTLSVQGNVKAVELVRGVVRELPPEVRQLMPNEESLIKRVRKWAKAHNIQLVRANPQDYLLKEGEELLIGFSEASGFPGIVGAVENADQVPVKTGVVYTESDPGVGDDSEDKKPSGLVFLKGKIDGNLRAVIEGQGYVWQRDLDDDKQIYVCQESHSGCLVTVLVDNREKRYELRGIHLHGRKTDKRKANKVKNLKRVDESGVEIGLATLDEVSATGWNGESHNDFSYPPSTSHIQDFDFQAERDFQVENESQGLTDAPPIKSGFRCRTVVSSYSKGTTPQSGSMNPTKTGERCFVCGDDLILSEVLATSEQTFHKACCYLNVKSNGDWFPKGKDSRYYSFCESCTKEIINISNLYEKVDEMQSLIFKQIESVEKRVAEAEIVDHWMSETPPTTALRYEGFRKQVMINYRNKLRVRREVRYERKTGRPFVEIQPSATAHMYAKDPSETLAFRRVPDSHSLMEASKTLKPLRPIRGKPRGRPRSRKSPQEQDEIARKESVYISELPVEQVAHGNDSNLKSCNIIGSNATARRKPKGRPKCKRSPEQRKEESENEANDDCNRNFSANFDDTNADTFSEASEKEIKFWEDDPSELYATMQCASRSPVPSYVEGHEKDEDTAFDKVDTDYVGDNDTVKPTKSTMATSRCTDLLPASGQIIFENKRYPRKTKKYRTASNNVRESHCKDIKFPDAVLTKDGRVFMEGIEIIKNSPGTYKQRPYSVSFSCGACGKVSLGFWKIRQHICGHHLGMYKCNICLKQYSDPGAIERHMIMFHGGGTHKTCEICEKPIRMLRNESVMRYHRWSHLSEEEKKDPQYASWCPPKERNHNSAHARFSQSFMCDTCGKTFRMPSALKNHELTHRPGYEQQVLMCHHCGKIFKNKKGLSQHVALCYRKLQGIVNTKRYPCPKCPTYFCTRATRSKHMKRFHSKVINHDLPFSCPKCPRSFANRSAFKSHKRVCLDGEKGYNKKVSPDSHPSTSGAISNQTSHGEGIPIAPSTPSQFIGESNQFTTTALMGYNYNFVAANFHGNNSYS